MVAGWEDDVIGAGGRIRTAALPRSRPTSARATYRALVVALGEEL
jgi:hypothetical protein